MAAVPVTITGMYAVADGQITITGLASITGVGVGGGPMPGGPDHIWGGGGVPMPTPPIANVPGAPGYQPPHPAHPIPPIPAHPIELPPDPPTEPPTEPPTNPPSDNWVWGYSPQAQQWMQVYVPGEGQAGPKT